MTYTAFNCLLLVAICSTAFMRTASASGIILFKFKANSLTIVNSGQSVSADLRNGILTFETDNRAHKFIANVLDDGDWAHPTAAIGSPNILEDERKISASITYPVAGKRELTIKISAYKGLPGIFVRTKLRNLGSTRTEYYFWQSDVTFDHYFTKINGKIDSKTVDKSEWKRFGFLDWIYLPAEKNGVAIVSTGEIGRSPGDSGSIYFHAFPRSRTLATGESLYAGFGLLEVDSLEKATDFYDSVIARNVKEVSRDYQKDEEPSFDYGKPAPEWVAREGVYNGFYYDKSKWTDSNIKNWLKNFPLIVGVPHDKETINRCQKAGIRVIAYVNYMELLNTEIELKANGTLYYEWTSAAKSDSFDMAKNTDWACIDKQGNVVMSTWGAQNGHPGLTYTCFHQKGLWEAAIAQVRALMEMGADGVFIDNAMHVADCYGDLFGKHKHADHSKTNTDMYEQLLSEIYNTVKSYGDDKIVMQNSNIIRSHWLYSDAQMWESAVFGSGMKEYNHTWEEMKYFGEMHSQAMKKGKVPVILSYVNAQPNDKKIDAALFSYAYARIYGFLWADWFTTAFKSYEEINYVPEEHAAVLELYSARLGNAKSDLQIVSGIMLRRFENGWVLLNPADEIKKTRFSTEEELELLDVGYGRVLSTSDKGFEIEMAPKSGRVLVIRDIRTKMQDQRF